MFPSCYPLIEALHIPDNHDKEERYVVVHGVPSYVSFCSLSKPWGKEMWTHALDSSTLSRFSVQPNCSTSNTCRSLAVPESWKVPVGLTCCPDGRRCAIITQNGHVAIFQDPQPMPQIVEAPFLEMQADESSFRTVIASENTLRGSSISWSPLNKNALLYGYAVWLGQSCNTCTLYAHDVTTQSSWPVELTCATVTSLSYSPHHASRFVLCTPHDFVQVCDVRSPLAPQIALNGKDRGAIYHATHHPVDEYYIATCTPPRERAGWNSAPTNPASSSYHRNNNASFVYVWDIRQPNRAVRQTQLWGNQSIAGLRWLSEKDGNTRSVGFNAALVPTLVVAMHDTPYLSILHFEDLHPGLICNAVGRRSNGVEELSLLDGYESVCSESTSNRSSGGASRRSSHQTSTLRKSSSAFRLTSNATSLLNVENRYICVSPYPHTSARNLMQKKDSANDGAPDVPPSQTPTIHAITTSPYQRDRVLAVVSDCGDVVSLEVAPHAPLSLWYQPTFASALPLTAPDHRGFPLYSIQVTNGVVQMCSLNLSAETSGTRFVRRIQKGFLLDPYRNGEILHDEGNDDAALLFHWINMVHRLKRSQPNAGSREDDVQPDSSQPLSGIGLSVGIIEFMSSVLKEVEDATNTNNYSDIVQDKDSTNSIAFLSPLLQNKIQFLLYLCGWSNVPLASESRERAEILEDTYVTTHALGTHTHRSTETNVDSKNDHAQCTLGGTALGSSEVGWNDQDVRFGQADVLWPDKFLQKRELFERKVFMLVVTKRYLSARDLLLSRLHSIAPNGKEETSPRTACGTDSEASSYFLLSVLIESKAYLIACRNASSNVPSQHTIKDAVTSAIQNLPLPRYLAATVEVLLHRSSDSTTPNSNSLEDFSNTERTLWEKLCHLLPLYDVVGSLALRAFEEQGDPRHVIALLEQIQEWYRLSRHPLACVSLCGFGNPQASELLQRYVDCHGDLQVVLAVAAFAAQGEDLSEKWAKWSGDYRMWCNNSGQCMHRCEMDLAYHEIQELHGTSALDKQEEVVRSRVRARTTLRCTSCSQPLGSPTKELASSCIPGNREHRGDFVRGRFRPFARAADDLSGGNLAPGTLCTNPLCRRPLPRCSVCLNPMGGGDRRDTASNNGAILGNTAHLTDTWFVWCTLCHHGGHKEHLQQWFAMNEMCPVDSCGCRCST